MFAWHAQESQSAAERVLLVGVLKICPETKARVADTKAHAAKPKLLPEKLKMLASGPCNPGMPKQMRAAKNTALAIAIPLGQFL